MKKIAKLSAVIVLFTSSIGCSGKPDEPKIEATAALPNGKVEETVNVPRPDVTFQIRHPRNRGEGVRVRLDAERLRAYNLSKEDVMKAMKPSGIVDPKEPLPPSGVMFVKHLFRPDQYENVILRANVEGEILHLKDVGKVDAEPLNDP